MTLSALIHKKSKSMEIATATVATHANQTKLTVANVASVAVAITIEEKINYCDSDLEKIRSWLFQIDEPEEDHYLVLNKCRNDRDAFSYFMKWTRKNEE